MGYFLRLLIFLVIKKLDETDSLLNNENEMITILLP